MKARLFVVDENTRVTTIRSGEASVYVPEPEGKEQWNKTLIDIMSDLLQLNIGDYIFLWEKKTKNIYGVYRVVSKPFYRLDEGKSDIFKVKIQEAYSFKEPINEYDVINNPYMKNQLWNIIGKKVAGKSRGTSPITNEEMQFLIQLLIDRNANYQYISNYEIVEVEDELRIDFINEYEKLVPVSINEYKYEPIKIRNGKEVHYEKAMEAVMNYLFRERKHTILNELEINVDNVIWYANYLPYGLEGTEIDYMVMESEDGQSLSKIDVIELMKGIIDIDHIKRNLQYAKWARQSIANGNRIVRPVLICSYKSNTSKNGFENEEVSEAIKQLPKEYGFNEIEIFTYEFEDENIKFAKYIRGEEDE